ncbi:hypothetical protein ZWY2020_015610 [Hordeum vulgare]|nr:hypothetical protein ZWY2020_015610 [Hordeum vulgare]
MPHLHRLPVVLSIAGVKTMVQLVVTLDDQSVPRGIFLLERGACTRQGWWSMVKMAAKGSNGKEKLQCMDLSSDDSERSYKRSRQADPETTPEQQLVNYVKSVRVEKGDAVVIYLPMLMELPIAMLACSRIGPVHSVVFAGFSADAIAQRITDCKPKVIHNSL